MRRHRPAPETTNQRRRRGEVKRGKQGFPTLLLPLRETAVSAVRVCFLAARLDCGVTLEGGELTLTKDAKLQIIGNHGRSEADTGSAQVQIALLTSRINEL